MALKQPESLRQFRSAIARIDDVHLHEGLPHQTWESNLFAEELKTKQVHYLKRFPFYKEPFALKMDEAAVFSALMVDLATYRQYSGPNLCGGFHPDFALEWRPQGEASWYALICFGCQEIKLYGPAARYHGDLAEDAFGRLKNLLKPFRKNRPDPDPQREITASSREYLKHRFAQNEPWQSRPNGSNPPPVAPDVASGVDPVEDAEPPEVDSLKK
ncbi:MAG TPA: hypothetical protein VFV71_03300 [Burkholderiales bacterium]|nr:hypothetical protein [Burkholderiales bacterium]